jgi:DNA-binding transcriptional regulator YiaG
MQKEIKNFKKLLMRRMPSFHFLCRQKRADLLRTNLKKLLILQRSGLSIAEMARYLGVSESLIRNRFRHSIKARAND